MTCPFCGSDLPGETCPQCQRNRRQARAPCSACGQMTPTGEAVCSHCTAVQYRGPGRKIAAIIVMFAIAIALSAALQMALG